VSVIPKHYEALLRVNPNDLDVLRAYKYHCEHLTMDRWKARMLGLRKWYVETFVYRHRHLPA
jgi:hypothetical protein